MAPRTRPNVYHILIHNLFDLTVCLLLILYALVMWWPTRYLPFHWDSAGFYINATQTLVANRFSPLVASHSDFAHPPLLIVLSALVWQLTSGSIIAQHLLMFPFLPLLLISTYCIGKKVSGPMLGLAGAAITATLPVTLAEYGIIYIDLPSSAFTTLAIALWVYKKQLPSILALTAAVLTKETTLLILPLMAFLMYQDAGRVSRRSFRLLLVPLAAILIYWFYHQTAVGWLLVSPEAQLPHRFARSLQELQTSLFSIVQSFALAGNRWLLFIPGVASLLYLFQTQRQLFKTAKGRLIAAFFLNAVFILLVFTVIAEFAPRYALFYYPLTIIALLWGILKYIKVQSPVHFGWAFVVASAGVVIAFYFAWFPPQNSIDTFDFKPPADLSYIDMVRTHQMLGLYLSHYYPTAHIYGAFPENIYLTQPIQGYVGQPLTFSFCYEFESSNATEQIVVAHKNSPLTVDCHQLTQKYTFRPLQHFESGNQFIDVYLKISTPSANLVNPEN